MLPRSRICGLFVVTTGFAITFSILFHFPVVDDASARTGGSAPNVTIIDGSQVQAGFGPLPGAGEPGAPTLLSATDSPTVVTDGWTMRLGDSRSLMFFDAECYSFNVPTTNNNRILFNVNLKVPRGGIPNELWGDLILVSCTPRIGPNSRGEDMPPVPQRAIYFDDIQFGNPGSQSDPYQIVGFIRMDQQIENLLGTGTYDWMLVTDSSALSAGDDDGDGRPDVGIEVTSSGAGLKLRPSVDEVGGAVIEAFAGNVRRVNVFEPAGTYPPARSAFGGSQAGETGSTRPWCFRIQ
ncbi:MAG: hypothetical protein HYR85_07220 [Planctomycetes bacterium]|nr:hypothetical protein [Planctomycetota bacterium]MBI3848525.1 hypothetical protein [Planctomycetota bacterium]